MPKPTQQISHDSHNWLPFLGGSNGNSISEKGFHYTHAPTHFQTHFPHNTTATSQ